MKLESRKEGGGADHASARRSRHAVLWRMAGRGGDGAEQSNQIMSGVCGHWVKSFQAFHRPCPASGDCPIGAFQAVVGSSKFSFSYYITGFLILLGVLLGRFICGFLCPFGWFQELLHKIPTKKLSTKKLRPLTYLKYAVLLVMVLLLPAFLVNDVGMGDPFFCKYLCPQGVLEGALSLIHI